jgi:signal transduction histidine kinase
MGGDGAMDQATAVVFYHNKHVQQTKGRGYDHEEITGNDALSVQASAANAFHPQPSSLSDLINDVGQKFQEPARSAGVSLHVELPAQDVQADVDVGLIERVLESLLGNAIWHTPAGGRVTLALVPERGYVSVVVGLAIPPKPNGMKNRQKT